MEAQVLQAFGLSQADFQAGIMTHQENPKLHEVIQDMQVSVVYRTWPAERLFLNVFDVDVDFIIIFILCCLLCR